MYRDIFAPCYFCPFSLAKGFTLSWILKTKLCLKRDDNLRYLNLNCPVFTADKRGPWGENMMGANISQNKVYGRKKEGNHIDNSNNSKCNKIILILEICVSLPKYQCYCRFMGQISYFIWLIIKIKIDSKGTSRKLWSKVCMIYRKNVFQIN